MTGMRDEAETRLLQTITTLPDSPEGS